MAGVLEKTKLPRLPSAILKYFFCSNGIDQPYKCLPTAGGLYDQRYRDYIEFGIIEKEFKIRSAAREAK